MSRRSKDKNVTEHLRGIIRSLKKQLSIANKRAGKIEHLVDSDTYDEEPNTTSDIVSYPVCDKCGKGPVNIIDMSVRLVYNCINPNCKYRKTTKKT